MTTAPSGGWGKVKVKFDPPPLRPVAGAPFTRRSAASTLETLSLKMIWMEVRLARTAPRVGTTVARTGGTVFVTGGVDYNFCAMAEFARMIDASELLVGNMH